MPNCKTLIISAKTRKKLRKQPITGTPKQIAYIALKQEGLNSSQAAKSLNISKAYASMLDKKIPAKYSLTNVLIVKSAFSSLRSLSKGIPVGHMVEVKGSDVLGACKEIYARAEPTIQKIQATSLSINLSDATARQMLDAVNGSALYLPDVSQAQDADTEVINV